MNEREIKQEREIERLTRLAHGLGLCKESDIDVLKVFIPSRTFPPLSPTFLYSPPPSLSPPSPLPLPSLSPPSPLPLPSLFSPSFLTWRQGSSGTVKDLDFIHTFVDLLLLKHQLKRPIAEYVSPPLLSFTLLSSLLSPLLSPPLPSSPLLSPLLSSNTS